MHELGVIFYTGEWRDEGVPASAREAVRYLRMGAEGGVPGSMFLLGECLLAGHGVAVDVPEAFAWFVRAGGGARSPEISRSEGSAVRVTSYQEHLPTVCHHL